MKISKKEKLILIMLTAVLGSVAYYQLVYTVQKEEIAELLQKQEEVQNHYNEVVETIQTLEKRQKQITISYNHIVDNSGKYYPNIVQENIILEIDKLLKDNLISANISFTEVTTEGVEAFKQESTPKQASSVQELIDQYDKKEAVNSESNQASTDLESTSATVEQMKLSVSFNALYDGLKTFLQQAQEYERELVITDLTLTPGTDGNVSGSFNLELYAFPKFDGIDGEYTNWTLENMYGKTSPFSSDAANGAYANETPLQTTSSSDFLISLKSTTSTLPRFMMGLTGDKTKDSYLMSEENGILNVTLTLSQKDGEYTYRYETDKESYPAKGVGVFTPKDTIHLVINSEKRVTPEDTSGIKLNLVNETDKNVLITINNDDQENPRVSISADATRTEIVTK